MQVPRETATATTVAAAALITLGGGGGGGEGQEGRKEGGTGARGKLEPLPTNRAIRGNTGGGTFDNGTSSAHERGPDATAFFSPSRVFIHFFYFLFFFSKFIRFE